MVRKKQSEPNLVLIGGVALVVTLGGILAMGQDWKTGKNTIISQMQASMGDKDKQYEVAQDLLANTSVAENKVKAKELLRKAAKAGHVKAMHDLADIYNAGESTADGDSAVYWYTQAANAGDAVAMRKLAYAYTIGRGKAEPDAAKGLAMSKKAAEAGDAESQAIWGESLVKAKKFDEALPWLEKSEKSGSGMGPKVLGDYYASINDWAKAQDAYRRSAELGYDEGQVEYALALVKGKGAPKNNVEAYKWATIAASGDSQRGSETQGYVAGLISRDEAAAGDAAAKEWLKTHKK